jgi:hypothetical protein
MRWLVSIGAAERRGLAIAGAAAAVVIGLSAVSGAPGLVDRADAAINVRDQVLHEVDITDFRRHRYGVFYERTEGWLLRAHGAARVIEILGYERARYVSDIFEWIRTATGRVFARTCLNYCRSTEIGSFINGRSRWADEGRIPGGALVPPILPGTYAGELQAAYRVHAAVPKGITTFAGKRVNSLQSMEAYVGPALVSWRPGTRPPVRVRNAHGGYALVEWYIDRATAEPVGFKTWGCAADHILSCKARGAPVATTRIVTFQRLDPTPENLAQLTGPNAPRGAR